MGDAEGPRSLRDIAVAGLRLEYQTDAGRVNAFACALFAAITVLIGAANGLELLIKLVRPSYETTFPLVAVLLIFAGVTIFCVAALVLLQPLVTRDRQLADRHETES